MTGNNANGTRVHRSADEDERVGALVTLELPADSPIRDLPWIVTFGPLGTADEWEPVVCGPYERAHALALAESVVVDGELMAVVEPLLPRLSVDEIKGDIAAARMAAEDEASEIEDVALHGDYDNLADLATEEETGGPGYQTAEPQPPPSPDEVRAGFARIAALLTSPGS